MAAKDAPFELTDLGLAGADVKVRFSGAGESESVYRPPFVRIGPEKLFVSWPEAPAGLEHLEVDWVDCPFTPGPLRCPCAVVGRSSEGLTVQFETPPPATMREWFERVSLVTARSEPDSALRTSKLYTGATVVSAGGLFCGALAILLPIVSSGQWWIDAISKVLLLVMVCSIAGFAWIRFLAGRAEVRAIRQSPH